MKYADWKFIENENKRHYLTKQIDHNKAIDDGR